MDPRVYATAFGLLRPRMSAPVKTGMEFEVKVFCDEGVATHIDPEPCGVAREGGIEASAGERAGQPLSREKGLIPDADAFHPAEGNTTGRDIASVRPIRRGRRPWHARTLHGREPGGLLIGQSPGQVAGPRREGEEP
jgi:hypothetical protein